MNVAKDKTTLWLSILIAGFALITTLGGLFLPELYRDNAFVQAVWKGNDLVTLVIALPIFIAALIFMRQGSKRSGLVWLGMLDYFLYNFAFYLFAASFNWFFLLYLVCFTCSIFALIFGLLNLDVKGAAAGFRPKTPVRWISGYMLFIAVGLTTVYLMQTINFIVTGTLPSLIITSGHVTAIVFALDLSLLVPWLALGAVWLWQKRPWGYALAAITLTKGFCYTFVLTVGSLSAARAGYDFAMSEVPLWATLTVGSLIAVSVLLFNLRKDAL